MAFDVQLDTIAQVFNYRPRPHTKPKEQAWLLWPAYVYRVVAPSVRQSQINVFQKAVLGFYRAGENDLATIASKLNLESELIAVIIDELQESKLINANRRITELGVNMLAEERNQLVENAENAALTVGYVFQDPWSGLLWPRLAEHLQYQEVKYQENKNHDRFPTLIFGSKGKPWYRRPFVQRASGGVSPEPPDAREILDASYRHQRALRHRRPYDLDMEDDMSFDIATSPLLERVSVVSEKPGPCFLTSIVYLPADDAVTPDWYVCDPFGLGSNPDFRKDVERQIQRDTRLKTWIDGLLAKGETSIEMIRNGRQVVDELATREATKEIDRQLGLIVNTLPYYDHLVAMERAHQETKLFTRCPPDKFDDVLIKAGKVLEAAFGDIQSKYPVNDAYTVFMTSDRQYRQELLNEFALQLGFVTPLPDSLASVRPETIRYVAQNNAGSLGQRVVLSLLIARLDMTHPLWYAAQEEPNFFSKIGDMITLRNQSAHADKTELNAEQMEYQVANCYAIVRAILPRQTSQFSS